ncbi:shTK domain protein, partial [Ancylostoma caninum]
TPLCRIRKYRVNSVSIIVEAVHVPGVAPQQFLNCVISGGRSCCDKHRFCAFWARNNECSKNPTWMLPNCQLSCRVCTTDSVATQTLR